MENALYSLGFVLWTLFLECDMGADCSDRGCDREHKALTEAAVYDTCTNSTATVNQ